MISTAIFKNIIPGGIFTFESNVLFDTIIEFLEVDDDPAFTVIKFASVTCIQEIHLHFTVVIKIFNAVRFQRNSEVNKLKSKFCYY
jgi:hypothetical protein